MKLDSLLLVEAPEGVELSLRPAGPVPRVLAYGFDLLLRSFAYGFAGIVAGFLGGVGVAFVLIAMFAGEWFYGVLFEQLADGRTPGKRLMGLRVVAENGTPPSWSASVLRNFLLCVDFLPPPFGAGWFACAGGRAFQRIGDHAAGTLVVHDPTPALVPGAPRPAAAAVPLPVPLERDEQRALRELFERSGSLSPARLQELTDLLAPLTGARGRDGLERALGMGADLAREG